MKNTQLKLWIERLIKIPAPSGYEGTFGLLDEIEHMLQRKGKRIGNNLIYTFGAKGPKLLLSAHIDEVGFFIVQKDGQYYANPIGFIDIKPLNCPIPLEVYDVISGKLFAGKLKNDSTVVLDTNETLSQASLAVFKKNISWSDDIISAPSLDNKTGVTALMALVSRFIQTFEYDFRIDCVFASCEEQNMNGVMRAVRETTPDFCIDIDSAYAQPYDEIESKTWLVPEIGKGPALQLMGSGWMLTDNIRSYVEKAALRESIPLQYELPSGTSGGTNAVSYANAGIPFCQINIPVADQHTKTSLASMYDIIKAERLLAAMIKNDIFSL